MNPAPIAAVLLAAATPAFASVAASTTLLVEDDNAALLYWRAFELFDADVASQAYDAMQTDEGALAPGSNLAKLIAQDEEASRLVLRASASSTCDFGIDYSEGFNTVLPHLGKMRSLARYVGADARRLELAGDIHGAVLRTVAEYRMADHLSRDGVLINALVGVAIANVGHQEARRLAAMDLTEADRTALLQAIDDLGGADPFHIVDSIRKEQSIVRDWVTASFTGEDAAMQFYKGMTDMAGAQLEEDVRQGFASMSEAEFDKQVDQAADLYDVVIGALEAGDVEKLDALNAEINEGKHGLVARIIVPSFSNLSKSKDRAESELASTRAALMPQDK